MRRTSIILLALLAFAGPARAGIDAAGTTSANFLSVGNGASVLAMGGAAIGTGGSLNAAAWNPASLGQLAGPQYSISHATLAMQTSQDWLAAGGRVRGGATRWSLNAIYENDGDFEGRDALGASTGTFNASNLAFGAAFARPFGATFALGAGVKWVNQYLGEVTGSGLGFDLGVQGRAGAFGFGAAARNVGGNVKFDGASFPMPAVYGFGASWTDAVHGLRFNLDANFPSAYYNDVRFGGEWMWQNRVALRGGYRMELGAETGEPLGGPTFGMGAGSNGMWVDYAFLAGQSDAQGAHRLSFSVHPGFMNPGGLALAPTPIAPRDQLADARASEPRVEQPKPVAAAREPRAEQPQSMAIVREPAGASAGVTAPAAPVAIVPTAPAAPSPAKAAAQLPAPVLSIVRASEPAAPAAPVSRPQIVAPTAADAAPLAARDTDAAPRAMRAGQSVRVPKLVVPKVEPVAIVREPVTPPPAPVAIVRAPEPVAPVAAPVIVAPVAADAAPLAARTSVAAPRAMNAGQALRVPKLVVPKLEPVAIVREPAAAPPAPVAIVREPAKSPVQLAASAPVTPVVVPNTAPSTEPIARPQPVAPPAPAKRPAVIVVQPGQTLADLARQWDNSVPSLMMENNLVSEQVKPGQKLRLPPAGKK
ncbi:MAG: PorV/PorQ family protein [Candidatus Eisenbacteria bacterium]